MEYIEIIKAVVEIIKAVAWPISTIWLGYIFREEVRNLFGRISSLKYEGTEVSFGTELASAEKSAKLLNPSIKHITDQTLTQKEQLLRIAEVSPRAAIVEAWRIIENAALENGLCSGTTIQRTNPKIIIEHLEETGKFSRESLELIHKLRNIRNQAAHLSEFVITQSEAERYLDLAVQSAAVIEATTD